MAPKSTKTKGSQIKKRPAMVDSQPRLSTWIRARQAFFYLLVGLAVFVGIWYSVIKESPLNPLPTPPPLDLVISPASSTPTSTPTITPSTPIITTPKPRIEAVRPPTSSPPIITQPITTQPQISLTSDFQRLLFLTNQKRAQNYLSPVRYNQKLARAAQAKAEDMVVNNYFSHYSPDGHSATFFAQKENYKYSFVFENLGRQFRTVDGVFASWVNSPTHYRNIISSEISEIGFGYAEKEIIIDGVKQQEKYIVQLFGEPFVDSY